MKLGKKMSLLEPRVRKVDLKSTAGLVTILESSENIVLFEGGWGAKYLSLRTYIQGGTAANGHPKITSVDELYWIADTLYEDIRGLLDEGDKGFAVRGVIRKIILEELKESQD